jgi:uncharacterized protein YceK
VLQQIRLYIVPPKCVLYYLDSMLGRKLNHKGRLIDFPKVAEQVWVADGQDWNPAHLGSRTIIETVHWALFSSCSSVIVCMSGECVRVEQHNNTQIDWSYKHAWCTISTHKCEPLTLPSSSSTSFFPSLFCPSPLLLRMTKSNSLV